MWKCGRNFVPVAIQRRISSVSRFGSIEEIRKRSMPDTASSAFSRSRKVSPVLLPKSPVFTPVSTTSTMPCVAMARACSTISAMGMLRLLPRASGTVQ